MDGKNNIDNHFEKMQYMRNGGKLECPFCAKGMISMVSDEVFRCDTCKKGMTGRKPLNITT